MKKWSIVIFGIILAVLLAVWFSPVSRDGEAVVSCEVPISMAGQAIDFVNISQAPCNIRVLAVKKTRVLGVFGIYSKGVALDENRKSKEMFAYLSSGETPFPADAVGVCSESMTTYVKNNKETILEMSTRENSSEFRVFCSQKAQF